MTLKAGTPVGRYLVRRKLAEGGMAEIYLCTVRGPEGFAKEVVIKRIRSFLAGDPGFVRMFIAEARLASRLNHANLVQIFDFDKHEDTYYLAMEYVRGKSLAEITRRAKELMQPMPPLLVARLGADVARGLHYAHQLTERGEALGLVHRDVTPQNVLISFEGAVKLTDFGIAKAGNGLTSPGMLKGKFSYMSPEQARGEHVDARTDVFALGVVLWELLTGGKLFEGDSDVAVLRAVQTSQIAPPVRLNPDVPQALSDLVLKALERDREQRIPTAQDFERALSQFILGHARSVDDTDMVAYLRRLFSEEMSTSRRETGDEFPEAGLAVAEPPATPDEPPTALEPAPATSPDEDGEASTFISTHRSESSPVTQPPPSARSQGPGSGITAVLAAGVLLLALGVGAWLRSSWDGGQAPVEARADAVPQSLDASVTAPPMAAGPQGRADAGSTASASLSDAGAARTSSDVDQVAVVDAGPALEKSSATKDSNESVERKRAPRPRARPGTLIVRATPWAELFIDGRAYGEVAEAQRRVELPAGKHKVEFRHPMTTRTFVLTISAGKETLQEVRIIP